jgi:hypothetical protein
MEKMTQSNAETVGVDISKDQLDVHIHPVGKAKRFTNDAKWTCPALVERH